MKLLKNIIKEQTENTAPENTVIGFSGSPRKNGNSDLVLKQVLQGVEDEKIESCFVRLQDVHFQGCIGCEQCRKDKICTGIVDGLSLIYRQIILSKGLVLVSPTHNYNITSWMKAFIDRLYCFYQFELPRPGAWSSQLADQGRKAVIIAICEQENEKDMGFTIDAMREPIKAIGYDIVSEQAIFHVFEKGKVKSDSDALDQAYNIGKEFASSIVSSHTPAL
ncbi:flavodoxin family protein [Spirochaeta dissipatitropha]